MMDDSIKEKMVKQIMDEVGDDFTVDGVERYTPGDPVPDNKIPVRGCFDELVAVRCCLEPQDKDASLKQQTFICFRSTGPEDALGKVLKEMTGARTVNLWYRVEFPEGRTMTSIDDLGMLRSLEQMLVMYEEEKKARMQ